jgi:hypothetical protein
MYSFAPAAKQRSRSPSIANAVKAMIGVSIKLGSSRIWAIASHHPQTRSPKSQYQTAIAPHHPKTDRLNLNIKQRSPLTPTKPDRLFPSYQTAIALHHTQTRSPIPHTKQRSPLKTHKTRSPFPSNQNSDHTTPPINRLPCKYVKNLDK